MLYSPTVRKKLDAATVIKPKNNTRPTSLDSKFSKSSQNNVKISSSSGSSSSSSISSSSDDRKNMNKIQLYKSTHKPSRLAKPSKSETTISSLPIAFTRTSSCSQPLYTRKCTSNDATTIKTVHKKEHDIVEEEEEEEAEEEEENELQKLNSRLKTTFLDVIESSTDQEEEDIVDMIRSQLDAQTVRIRRLERALKEKDEIIKEDDVDMIPILLKRYPHAMDIYKKQIEQTQFNQQLETCIDQFESQKQKMMEEHQRNFQILKQKYRSRFDDIVERMISDPSRLDDEWARRVKKDADDRIEEMKRFLHKKH